MTTRESQGFIAAYEACYSDVFRYVRRRAHSAIVDEIVAETFLIAWRRRDVLPDEPRAWLFRTAANVMRATARRETRQIELAVRSYEPPSPVAELDDSIELSVAWRRLSRKDQEVIALNAWEGLTDDQAAEVLGCRRAAYSMRLSRARKRLLSHLSDGRPDEAHGTNSYAEIGRAHHE